MRGWRGEVVRAEIVKEGRDKVVTRLRGESCEGVKEGRGEGGGEKVQIGEKVKC